MPDGIGVAVQHRLRFFREGMRLLFEGTDDIRVAGAAVSAADLLGLCHRTAPDVAVVQVDGDPAAILRSCATLADCLPDLRFVGVHGAGIDLASLRGAGLRSLVSRAEGFDRILAAVRAARRHEASPIGTVDRSSRHRKHLTSREVDVLSLVGAGHTSQEISERLAISRKTVENHKQRIFTKLDVQNQAHAVAVAVNHGLITPDGIIDLAAGRSSS